MKKFISLIFLLSGLMAVSTGHAADDFLEKEGKSYFPNCQSTTQALDRVWYAPRPLESNNVVRPDNVTLLKIHLYLGMGACVPLPYQHMAPVEFKFVPSDAWPLDEAGIIKQSATYVTKSYATQIITSENLFLDKLTVIVNRDMLKEELATKKRIKLQMIYTITGLYDGLYFDRKSFFKFSYLFEMRDDGKIFISLAKY